MKPIGLYIHIPFCSGKCPYCDFYSVKTNESVYDEYTKQPLNKIRSLRGKYRTDTVYFGGGTPSLLGTERLCRLLDAACESFGKAEEVTVEVNPESAPALDFSKLAAHGLNRVSMGLQSSDDRELALLGRRHTAEQAAYAVGLIKKGGISNISLDLMLGIGEQTQSSLEKSIDFCAELEAAHISAYILKIEEGTLYYRRKDTLPLPDEDSVCDLYELAVKLLEERGYRQYEISNFAKPGFESRHNLKYWRCEEYLGLGAAAHSFIGGRRFYCTRSLEDFYRDVTADDGEGGGKDEYIALALRLTEGLVFDRYEKRFGEPVPQSVINSAQQLLPTKLIRITDEGISLTVKGFLCSNAVISSLL